MCRLVGDISCNRLWSLKVGNREEMGGYTKVLEDENSRYLLLILEGITKATSVAHFFP
jgi:hypothetical protein